MFRATFRLNADWLRKFTRQLVDSRMSDSTAQPNILVILPNPMGDAILCTPALRRLHESFPGRLTFLANPTVQAILSPNPWAAAWLGPQAITTKGKLRNAIVSGRNLKRFGFDVAIIFPNSFRTALNVFLAGIPRRIGYGRDGRTLLLTDPLKPFRWLGRYAPMSMLDYYDLLAQHALACLTDTPLAVDRQADRRLELHTAPPDQAGAEQLLAQWQLNADQPLVILVPGGAFGGSKWWPAERFAQLADQLAQQHNARIIISAAPNDTERALAQTIITHARCAPIDLAQHAISLGTLKALIARASLVVSNDTGPCHITAAMGTPLVTLFGPTDPRWTATGYDRETRVRHAIDCGPCQQQVCPRDHRCMELISVDQVSAAAGAYLEQAATNIDTAPARQTPSRAPHASVHAHATFYRRSAQELTGTSYQPYDEQFVPLDDASGLVHDAYRPLLDQHKLATLADVFAYQQGHSLHKPGLGHRQRLRIQLLADNGPQATMYLKRYQRPPLGKRLKRYISRRSRLAEAVYDFAAALALSQEGVSVPRPIAYGQEHGRFFETRSFVISEELPQADALERLLPQSQAQQQNYPLLANPRELTRQVARLVARLHRAGWFHRDLYLSHIFLGKDRYGRDMLSLIDLQRVFRPRLCRRRWQIKDLAQLYYSAMPYCTRTDIARFLKTYCDGPVRSPANKRLARAIQRKAARIARHDHKRRRRLAPSTRVDSSEAAR